MRYGDIDSANVRISDVFKAIDHMCDLEDQYCKRYYELNPDDDRERDTQRKLIINALKSAKYEILRQCNLA